MVLDLIFIAIYQSVPLVWFLLLWRLRKRLNPNEPSDTNTATMTIAASQFSQEEDIDNRVQDNSISHISFLFKVIRKFEFFCR
jgi:hypothetical protein